MNLPLPHGYSVNDGIQKEHCSFHYYSVDKVAQKMSLLGKCMLLAKMDIKQAYRNIAIALGDIHLLGLRWDNELYVDQVLPFGLFSASLIFSAVADALPWIMKQRGTS